MIRILYLLIILFLPFSLPAGGNKDSGEEGRYEYSLERFSGIDGSSSFHIEVRRGSGYSVVIYADPALKEKLVVDKRGSVLHLGVKPRFFSNERVPRAVITMPDLESVELSGAATMIAAGFRDGREFKCDLSGAGSLVMDISAIDMRLELDGASVLSGVVETDSLELDISGGSEIELTGRGGRFKADLSGASTGRLKDYECTAARVELSGSSDLYLCVNGTLNLDASGASNMYYNGNVAPGDIRMSGASSFKRMGED